MSYTPPAGPPAAPPPPVTAEAIAHLAIIGAGTLGWQLACLGIVRGFVVTLHDVAPAALTRAHRSISDQVRELARSDGVDAAASLARLTLANALERAVDSADFAIEAVPESLPLKKAVFADLDCLAPPAAILATNSSSMRSRLVAEVTNRPDRVLNYHFLNFPWRRRYVEIMTCGQTSDASLASAAGLAKRLQLTPWCSGQR